MARFPKKNDRVCDECLIPIRWGVVTGINSFIDIRSGYDCTFVKVLWDTTGATEELEYESFFTQDNGGNGSWDSERNCWYIEPSGDELPPDNPWVVAFNKSCIELNLRLAKERLGSDANLSRFDLLTKSCEYRKQADDMGKNNSYYNWYKDKADDYALVAASMEQ